jgi:Amt family ammonium transporter
MASSFVLTVANLLANALERARAEDQIRHQALHDALTGLPNRALVVERLEHALARARRTDERVALLFLDLDHFKHVNDSLGHGRGDELLIAVSERLRSAVRPPDTVGRLGGDDFVVLCENVTEEIGALVIAERLTAALKRPFRLGDEEVFVSASVGVALPGPSARTAADLLRDADAALYRAKGAGRGRHELFDASLRARAVERLRSETALRHAVEREELVLHYQPIVSLQSGAVEAVEALVRWHRPGHGMVMPGEFIPIAEASGLIVEVGAWVVEAACEQLAAWNAARPDAPPLCVSLNLAARQVRDQDLPSILAAALDRSGVAPEQLQFEITETVLVEDTPETAARLRALLDLGVRLVLDDFGRGYSSLHYLTRFPITGLKLDRAFVAALPQRSTAAITAGVVGIARALDLAVVAEGVETESQLAAVRDLGCARAQGFLLSRPVEAGHVDAMRSTPPWSSLLVADGLGSRPVS